MKRLVSRLKRAHFSLTTSFKSALASRSSRTWRREKIALFEKKHGYAPKLTAPETFSEKLLKRILDDEDPNYRLYGLKLFAPHYYRSRSIEGLRFPKQLKVVRTLTPAVFSDLPEAFVIKSSFGSGLNEIVKAKSDLDVAAVCKRFNARRDLIRNAQNLNDTCNVVIFEEYLGDPAQGTPDDYKFHCFHSATGAFTCLVQIDSDRFGAHRQTLFDENFNKLDMRFSGQTMHEDLPPRPGNLGEMMRIAREISAEFDYVRVDLFNTDDGIFLGEITPFHQGAMAPISPNDWERRLGALWDQRFPSFHPAGSSLTAGQAAQLSLLVS